jgi:hypothetical protein
MTDLLTERTCHFSPCRMYRYSLSIIWDTTRRPQMFLGLNPSTADEENDDPTVRRCIDFAQRWGAGGLVMCNAAAYRATDPKVMLKFDGDKIGPENTVRYLERIAAGCLNKPIAAWGKHATKIRWEGNGDLCECHWNRHQELRKFMGPLDCLQMNGDGTPSHPLYLPATLTPIPFNYAKATA